MNTARAPGSAPFALGDIPNSDRLNEMEFFMPAQSIGTGAANSLSPEHVGRAFADHPSPELLPNYAARLASLPFLPLEGLLKGYIDLVFRRDGRWYVADYKTNHLGDHVDDYDLPRLQHAMSHGHYYLQSHLYSVAVHRYLQSRQPGYDYDTHFGGILYLFIKGMKPGAAPPRGVYFEKPPQARLEALSALFAFPPSEIGAQR